MHIAANDTGRTYDVVFFDGDGDDAIETDRVTGFTNVEAAIEYSIGAYGYARDNGIPWTSTEIVEA